MDSRLGTVCRLLRRSSPRAGGLIAALWCASCRCESPGGAAPQASPQVASAGEVSGPPAAPEPAAPSASSKRKPPMTFEQFFSDIERQLMKPPPRSETVLAAALRGMRVPVYQAYLVEYARDRMKTLSMRAEFLPSQHAQFIPFRRELGKLDVVRARYRARNAERTIVDVAQSKYAFVLRVRRPATDAAGAADEPLQLIRALRQEVFTSPLRSLNSEFDLTIVQESAAGAMPAFGSATSESYRVIWTEYLEWWVDEDPMGFVTLPLTSIQRIDPEKHFWWSAPLRPGTPRYP